ncbi:MAG: HDOD domain-containing protein [Deltaproteobacteria bacterium]|jgi:HD-like signal output (HDOD) protein|nr:HDOD domain-containing protein [Deltaproteobacteria bacterium]
MQPVEQAHAFLHKLLQHPPKLPFEPALLPMLFAITREDSTASIRDVTTLIGRSQKLSARVLALANSAAYGLPAKVSTLHQAINVLGIREIRLLVLLEGISSVISETKLPKSFDIIILWDHQSQVAAIAKALAAELGSPSGLCGPLATEANRLNMAPDEAYVVGFLHDIGKIFFAASRADIWETIEKTWKKGELRYFEAEHSYWDIDHALIGATVLHYWKLPLLLTEPINWHHAPDLATTYKMEARLLAAANHIVHSNFDVENGLCEEAVALLPEGIDATALVIAMTQSLASASAANLMAPVRS